MDQSSIQVDGDDSSRRHEREGKKGTARYEECSCIRRFDVGDASERWLSLSLKLIVLAPTASLFQYGMSLNLGVDFQGGMSLKRFNVDHWRHGERHERNEAHDAGAGASVPCGAAPHNKVYLSNSRSLRKVLRVVGEEISTKANPILMIKVE